MRRKLIKILLGLIGGLLLLFALYGLWIRMQMGLTASLQSGIAQVDTLTRRLIFPQTPLFYGALAGFFLLLTILLIWVIYRLVATEADPPQE